MSTDQHDISGVAMDEAVAPNKRKTYVRFGAVAALFITVAWFGINAETSATQELSRQYVSISTVKTASFEDYISIQLTSEPSKSRIIDSETGGRVKRILVENGALVEAGDLLLELKSFEVDQQVTEQQSAAYQGLRSVQKSRLDLENTTYEKQDRLAQQKFDLKEAEQNLNRKRKLAESGDVSTAQLRDLKERFALQQERFQLTLRQQENFEKNIAIQRQQFDSEATSYERDLAVAARLKASLLLKAPIAGILSGFDQAVGQKILRDAIVATVYAPETVKMTGKVSEQYLLKVTVDQTATLDINGHKHSLLLSKVDPDIANGQFEVDFAFKSGVPEGLGKGRTFSAKLNFTEPRPASLLSNGPFIRETGGRWVFVMNAEGSAAEKRKVVFGAQNIRYVEILDGLKPGDKVITSSYGNFLQMDKIELTE